MSELTIEINGKPKTFFLDQPNPPSEAQVMEIKRIFLAHNPNWGKVSAKPTPTRPRPMQGDIGYGQQDQGYKPVNPMAPGNTVEGAQGAPDPKLLAQVAQRAMAGDPVAVAQLSTLKAQGKQAPAPRAPGPNPILQQLPKPNLGLKPIDLKDPAAQKQAKEIQAKQRQEKAQRGLSSGTFGILRVEGSPTGKATVHWVQRGPGFEAIVEGTDIVVQGKDRPTVAKKVREVFKTLQTQEMSPNKALYQDPRSVSKPPNVTDPRTTDARRQELYGKTHGITDRDEKEAFNKEVQRLGQVISAAAGASVPIGGEAGKALREVAGQAVASVATTPLNLQVEANTLKSPEFTREEKAGALLNIVGTLATASASPLGPSLIDDALKLWSQGKPQKFIDALEKLSLEPNVKAAAKQFVKDNPQFTFKGMEKGKPKLGVTSASKVEPPKKEPPPVATPKTPEASVKPGASSYEDYIKAGIKRDNDALATVPEKYRDARQQKFSDDLNTHPERMNPNVYVPGKSGWEVTKKEWVALQPDAYKERAALGHQSSVEGALRQGQPVPDVVLADYPDLAKQYKRTATPKPPQKTVQVPEVKEPKAEAPKVEAPKQPGSSFKGDDPNAGATGLANQVTKRERDAGKLGEEIDIKGRSKEELHRLGKEAYEKGQINIQAVMRKLADEKRPATGVEFGAANEHKRRLMSRLNSAQKALDDAIGGGRQPGKLQYDLEQVEKEVTDWQNLVDESKTAWSDSGKGLQIGSTINEGDFAQVLLARKRKLGRDLTKRERDVLKTQVGKFKASVMSKGIPWADDPDELLRNIEKFGARNTDRVKAEVVLRQTRRPGKVKSIEQVRASRREASQRIAERIKSLREPGGVGGNKTRGAAYNVFAEIAEVIPDIVDDVKIIIRSVAEEYQIRKLDKSLFEAVRRELPGLEISDDEIIKTLAGEYDEKIAKEPTLWADLTRQARKQNAEPLRKAKAELAADIKKTQDEIREAEKKAAADARIRTEQKANAAKQAKQIEDDAARSLREEADLQSQMVADAQRKQLNELRKKAKKLEDRMDTLDDIDEQIKSGGFWENIKQVNKATKEQQMLDLTIKGKRKQIQGLIRERDMGAFERFARGTADTARSLRLGSDAGMLLRQGLYTLGRGKATGQGIKNFIKAVGDEDAWTAINESYYYKEAKDGRLLEPIRSHAGLATSDVFLDPEEITVIRILKSFPGLNKFVGSLERGQSAFINTVRREIFDDFVNKFPDATEAELKARARFINAATGRSNWKEVPKELQYVMTSPRYTKSRWELFAELLRNPVEAFRSQAARENLKDLGATAGSVLALLKIMEAIGFDVTWDPMSSDFLKVRRGNTVYDPTAGLGKVARAVFRTIAIADKHRRGEKVEFGTNVKDIIGDTFSDTASPIITGTYTGLTGKTIAGYDAKTSEKGLWLLAPLIVSGFYESFSEDGIGEAAANAVPEFFGVGVNRYASKEMDELGRPKADSQSVGETKVRHELSRLGIKIEANARRKTDTDRTWQARTKAQGDEILKVLIPMLNHPAYLKLTPTEKKAEIMKEVANVKKGFNREFNEAERARKDEENVRRIEKEMAAGAR